ncbi:MAG TPA: acyltransferase family protein [Polyangiaceae bacterium]|nr:acyltransferase family protein [Polyangiaceae bacterium]
MAHRKDIDGLRAIAVLSVLIFHLGWGQPFSGGFVGVDIFFVISGYLITGIVQADIEASRFSIAEFYERRVRRIFPALFVVYAATLLAASFVLFPGEAKHVGHDVLWSLGFLSNVAFSRAAGYFDQSAHNAPLLHTWSLSVEEQFYIGFPLLLWLLGKTTGWVRWAVLGLLTVSSFALSEWLLRFSARDAFYLVHCRAWELLLGALLALAARRGSIVHRHRWSAELIGVFGLGLIAFAIVAIQEDTAFPGVWALPPCLGAVALIYSGGVRTTLASSLLGSAPLAFIGRISYSLYLWHWPMIALYTARHQELTNPARWIILGASLGLATLSFYFVEQPFRRKPYRLSTRLTLASAAAGMLGVAGLALGVPRAAAQLRPASQQQEQALSYLDYSFDVKGGTCFLSGGFDDVKLFREDLCLALRDDRKNYLILGDSHAAHFAPAFRALRPDINFLQATASGCQAVRDGGGATRCTRLFRKIFDEFLPNHHVDAVVLAGHWPKHNLRALLRTIGYLRDKADRIIVLGPVVEYRQVFPLLLARSIAENNPDLIEQNRAPYERQLDRFYASRVKRPAEYYSVYSATCPGDECTLWAKPGVPMQYDRHHLTFEGAKLVLERLGPKLFR